MAGGGGSAMAPGAGYVVPAASVAAYSVWGSDSSQQLYRGQNSNLDGRKRDKKQVCSGLLIATSTLVFLAVLAIAAVAAYLGGKSARETLFSPCHLDRETP